MGNTRLIKYAESADNDSQYSRTLLNRVAGSMVNCISNLPEQRRLEELQRLTGGVCRVLRESFLGNLPIDEGIRRYFVSRAIALGVSDESYIAARIDTLSKQKIPAGWLRAFTGEI